MVDEMYSNQLNRNSGKPLKKEKLEYTEGNPLRIVSKTSSATSSFKTDHLSHLKHENLCHAHPISNEELKSLIKQIESTE